MKTGLLKHFHVDDNLGIKSQLIIAGLIVALVFAVTIGSDCSKRDLTNATAYAKERLYNLDNLSYAGSSSHFVYVISAISRNMTVKQMLSMCDMFGYLCDEMIEYEVRRMCFEIN